MHSRHSRNDLVSNKATTTLMIINWSCSDNGTMGLNDHKNDHNDVVTQTYIQREEHEKGKEEFEVNINVTTDLLTKGLIWVK